jgi:alkanesulfonate monooxygenase SsuD/methylene tetrahydromethanopterin reductase-like flavin-dependent oxidoreductase (luciferase family)
VRILKGVWTEHPFSFSGRYYRVGPLDEQPRPVQQPHPPILLGVGGPRSIGIAGRLADIVNFTARTRLDGGGIDPADVSLEALRRKCAALDQACTARPDPPERGISLLGVAVDEDVSDVARRIGWSIGDHLPELLGGPWFLHGGPAGIVDDLLRYRAEFGVSYFVILEHAVDRFAAILNQVHGQ